ncbi:hypothetical protein AaE_002799 [Aphanomyces astaci]|uniref:Uncharacterized protein n=1 Tax=Aphanomyces astaci TaxID=112090 RepID=A0A6A5ATC7_APHAT|nr:hypothetical protein AaE_003207 [Aphanomyces astaci]KAF0768219.1 hypothetical protein AaE_002798 [Aphanomyces astaci]KAF0768220.1 hypothetical protein AaE_002799 [Aphanomyces astaci]
MKYFAPACLLLAISTAVSSTAAPAGPLAPTSDESEVATPEWHTHLLSLRGGRRYRDDIADDDDDGMLLGRLAGLRYGAGVRYGGGPLWAAGGRGPLGGQFVAGGHGRRWVAGGSVPRGIQWAATGKLPRARRVGDDDNAPVVAAPLDDTTPRHLTEDESAFESDDFA